MISADIVHEGTAFIGADGEIRHIIVKHKIGSGYGVSWDSIPRSDPQYYEKSNSNKSARPRGYMTMREFQRWAEKQHFEIKDQSATNFDIAGVV